MDHLHAGRRLPLRELFRSCREPRLAVLARAAMGHRGRALLYRGVRIAGGAFGARRRGVDDGRRVSVRNVARQRCARSSAPRSAQPAFSSRRGPAWEASRSAPGPLVGKLEAGFRADAFNYLLVLRLVPVFPFWLVNLGSGIGRRQTADLSSLPPLSGSFRRPLIFASLGNGLGSVVEQPDAEIVLRPSVLLPILGLAFLALIPVGYRKMARQKAL